MPFVVVQDWIWLEDGTVPSIVPRLGSNQTEDSLRRPAVNNGVFLVRYYYIWFFGLRLQVPFVGTWEDFDGHARTVSTLTLTCWNGSCALPTRPD
jgi:hypothetical protein